MRFTVALSGALLAGLAGASRADVVNYDLSTNTEAGVNDAIFRQFDVGPSGSGNIASFVKITHSNHDVVQGVNVDKDGGVDPILDEDTTGTFLRKITLAEIPLETIDGKQYYQLLLDDNQNNGSGSKISLDVMELWVSSSSTNNVTKSGTSAPYTVDRNPLGTKVYSLDSAAHDNYLTIDTELSTGSGKADIVAFVPRTLFANLNPLTTYLYLYSEFGYQAGLHNNDGGEEWAVRTAGTFDTNTLVQVPAVPVPASTWGGLTLLGLLGAARARRARRA